MDGGRPARSGEHPGPDRGADGAPAGAPEQEVPPLPAPVLELVREPVRAPASLRPTVMRRVRDAAGTGGSVVVGDGGRGEDRVALRVVERLARAAAERVPGVALVVGRAHVDAEQGPGGLVRVHLDVTVERGATITELAEAVRRAVRRDLRAGASVPVGAVDVAVVDVRVDGPTDGA
ncbi:Asp23/Gls24 family envelope stress response protein [Vallicoccus soli]|nr:Asp23/Gls24 family envelope stress response protein [Vallicoccus soli]